MTDSLPDRLSTNPSSPHFDGEVLRHGIGIRLNGVQKHNVEEYCISEGWIRISVAGSRDRRGNPMAIKLKGTVESWYENPPEAAETTEDSSES